MAIADRSGEVEAIAILFITLAYIAVGMRCYVKLFMIKLFRIDDWLIVAALLCFTFYTSVVVIGARIGTGRHIYDVSQKDFSAAMMWWFCGEISYVTETALLKASIGLFLLQICVRTYQKVVIWSVIVVSSTFCIITALVMIFQCSPTSFFWTRFLDPTTGTCIDTTTVVAIIYTHGAVTTWSDWTFGIMPILLVWNLNMNPRTKVSVALILGLGTLGSVASIVRFPYLYQLVQTNDFLWANTDVSIWSTVEPGMSITACSIATMRPLFVAFLSRPKLFGSSTRSNFPGHSSRVGYFRKRANSDVEELELNADRSKTIRVTTTVVNTPSTSTGQIKNPGDGSVRSDADLRADNKWRENLDSQSFINVGHNTVIEANTAI